MKKIPYQYRLLTLLMLNVPAWGMDHAHMDMSMMSGMDMNMPMPTDHPKPAKLLSKKMPVKSTHHHAEKNQIVSKTEDVKNLPTAQETPTMDHHTMPPNSDMDMSEMDHGTMQIKQPTSINHDMNTMPTMQMDHIQHGSAPQNARSSDYSQGRGFSSIHPPMMMGNDPLMSLAVKRLEWQYNAKNPQGAYEIEGWWGDDWNRAVLKSEGKINDQSLTDTRTELLWHRPLSMFWNSELGLRQDNGNPKNRTWLALGINGISPYWLDLAATLYARDQSQTALILNAEYDWRITQSWVLQPRIEMSFYGKNDPSNDIGEGLSEVQSGLRLRYDANHQFAPYLGIESTHSYGKTADFKSIQGERTQQTFVVAGIHFWF